MGCTDSKDLVRALAGSNGPKRGLTGASVHRLLTTLLLFLAYPLSNNSGMTKKLPDDIKEYFRKQGAKGGKKAAAGMTEEQRKRRARKAAKAMHDRRKENQ